MVEGVLFIFHTVYFSCLADFSQFRVNVSLFFRKALCYLTLDQHCRCFSVQGEGAADLLGALGRSQELEAVDFYGCRQIPAAAWHCVPSGAWPKLRSSRGIPDEEERRLRSNEGGRPRCTLGHNFKKYARKHFDRWQ